MCEFPEQVCLLVGDAEGPPGEGWPRGGGGVGAGFGKHGAAGPLHRRGGRARALRPRAVCRGGGGQELPGGGLELPGKRWGWGWLGRAQLGGVAVNSFAARGAAVREALGGLSAGGVLPA